MRFVWWQFQERAPTSGCCNQHRITPCFSTDTHTLLPRVQEKWQEKQDAALAAAITELADFSAVGLSPAEKKTQKKELEARVSLLKGHASSYSDAGPQLHCVVWHDGDAWRAAIDTHELHAPESKQGLLADFTPMTNFRCASPSRAAVSKHFLGLGLSPAKFTQLRTLVRAGRHGDMSTALVHETPRRHSPLVFVLVAEPSEQRHLRCISSRDGSMHTSERCRTRLTTHPALHPLPP